MMRHAGRTRRCCKRPSQRCTARRRAAALGSAPLCIGCPAYRTSLVGNVDAGETNRFGDGMHGRCMAARRLCNRSRAGRDRGVGRTGAAVYLGRGRNLQRRLRRGQLELVARLAEAGVPTVAVGAARPVRSGGPARKRVDAGGIRVYGAEHSGGCARAARRGRTNRKAARDFMSGEEKMPDMRYAAGMDGGGTKTVLEARAPDGRVLLRERFGPLNLNSAAAQAVRETMPGLYGCVGAPARRPGGLCRAVRRQRGRQQSAGTRAAGANAAPVRIPGARFF